MRQELRLESTDFAAATELIGKLQASLVVAGMTLSVSPESRRQAENALIAEALAAFERARAPGARCHEGERATACATCRFPGGGSVYPVPFAWPRGHVRVRKRALARDRAGHHAHPYHGVRNHPAAVMPAQNRGAAARIRSMPARPRAIRALIFDVFGTVVDWRGSILRECRALGRRKKIAADWDAFTDAWRAGYRPAMARVRSGELPWMNIDQLHRMILDDLLRAFRHRRA